MWTLFNFAEKLLQHGILKIEYQRCKYKNLCEGVVNRLSTNAGYAMTSVFPIERIALKGTLSVQDSPNAKG